MLTVNLCKELTRASKIAEILWRVVNAPYIAYCRELRLRVWFIAPGKVHFVKKNRLEQLLDYIGWSKQFFKNQNISSKLKCVHISYEGPLSILFLKKEICLVAMTLSPILAQAGNLLYCKVDSMSKKDKSETNIVFYLRLLQNEVLLYQSETVYHSIQNISCLGTFKLLSLKLVSS